MSNHTVHLDGEAGEDITETVTVKPVEKFGFRILSGSVKKGDNLDVGFSQGETRGSAWKVTVKNRAQQAGRYYDIIYLKTDSKLKPEVKIRVFGHIKDEQTPVESGP